MLITQGDLLLTALFAVGLFQLLWLSVVLVRKGFAPSTVRTATLPLLSVWILLWPAYDHVTMPLYSIALLCIPLILAWRGHVAFARHLKLVWHTLPPSVHQPFPWLVLLITLLICAQLFALAPELGFGLALSFTLAWQFSDVIDNIGKGSRLGFAANPKQTLASHLLFVLATGLLCAWALQLYHGMAWHAFLIATLVVGLLGSIIRALVATGWNMPLAYAAMAFALWLL